LAVILLIASTASGCYDKVELEDVAWVQGMGFDKGPEGYIATTLQIGVPHTLGGSITDGGGGSGPHYSTITVLAKTALEALDLAAVNLGRRISLVHTQVFVFGEELARSDVRSLAGAMDRFREIRGTTLVAVAQGRAEDVLRVDISPLESSPSRFIQTILQQHQQTGLFEAASFVRDFVNLMESSSTSPRCPIIAIASDYKPPTGQGQGSTGGKSPGEQFPASPQVGDRVPPGSLTPEKQGPEVDTTQLTAKDLPIVGGGPIVVMGTACFVGGKMVGYLTGEETRAMLLVRHDLERAAIVVPDPEVPDRAELSIGVGITGVDSHVRVKREADTVTISVDIGVDVSYLSLKTQNDYTDPRLTPVVEPAIGDYLNKILGQAVTKTQKMGSDVFGFGEGVRKKFWTWPEFAEFAWLAKYPTTEVTTSVHAHIARYGLDLGPLFIPPSEKIQSPAPNSPK
jgi:spore germination protein KC